MVTFCIQGSLYFSVWGIVACRKEGGHLIPLVLVFLKILSSELHLTLQTLR
jgi:hypothetical protein